LFDCPAELGLGRASQRIHAKKGGPKEDRFERESIAFHQRVREGYLQIAGSDPDRVRVIDASLSKSEVHRIVCEIVQGKLRENLESGGATAGTLVRKK
jgi:dTMP kinase